MEKSKEELRKAFLDIGLGEEFDVSKKPENADESEKKSKEESESEEAPEEEAGINEEEPEDESEEEEEDIENQPPMKGIPPKEFNKIRSRNRELEEENKRISDELNGLKSKPVVPDEEVMAVARELSPRDATPEQIQSTKLGLEKILSLTRKESQLSEKERAQLSELQSELAELKDDKIFGSEWNKFEGSLEKSYPHATSSQIQNAQKAMDELAHAPQFADKEFDYVYFRNKDIFDEIMSVKTKKSFESRETYVPPEDENEEETDIKTASSSQKLKIFEKLKEKARQEDSWNVNDQGESFEA